MHRDEIVRFLDEYLDSARIEDASENGLQVEGRAEVRRIALGVSAHQELFARAARWRADMVLVHHGLLWRGQSTRICGVLGRRVRTLIEHDLSLVAYHLPLDVHPEAGNNAQIAKRIGLTGLEPFGRYRGRLIGFCGSLPRPIAFERLASKLTELFGTAPTICAHGPRTVQHVGVVSGGAAAELGDAIERGLDVYVTGHIDEFVPALCREAGIHYVAPGHYNSERLGVQALGRLLSDRFGLTTRFIEVANPY